MAAPKKPQDHKPKADASEPSVFTFEHGDKTHVLPPVESVASLVGGRVMRDAVMGGEEGQLRLAFFMLENLDLDPKEKTLDALYEKPATEMLEVVQAWMKFKPSAGVSLGE